MYTLISYNYFEGYKKGHWNTFGIKSDFHFNFRSMLLLVWLFVLFIAVLDFGMWMKVVWLLCIIIACSGNVFFSYQFYFGQVVIIYVNTSYISVVDVLYITLICKVIWNNRCYNISLYLYVVNPNDFKKKCLMCIIMNKFRCRLLLPERRQPRWYETAISD